MVEVDWNAVEAEALEHFQALLRFDTTNPPGDVAPATRYIAEILGREGIPSTVLEAAPGRTNLVARLSAGNPFDALMISAHLDVVAAEAERWAHPPFAGEIHDGYLWGRGAVDMKHMAVYGLMTLVLLRRLGVELRRDVVLAAIADEEAGMEYGSKWLAANHPGLIAGRWCLSEVGGFTLHVGGQRVYPIQRAEKGIVWLKMTTTGTPGHGSMPHRDNAVVKLSRALSRLAARSLKRHRNLPVQGMIAALARAAGFPLSVPLRLLSVPLVGDWVLDRLPGSDLTQVLFALLHDTACPTGLAAGQKENVIPSEASVVLDCRILPGSSLAELQSEIRHAVREDVKFEVIQASDPVVHEDDTPLFHVIRQVLSERDPGCHVVPSCSVGYTDGASYRKIGYTTYGFAPIRLPDDLVFSQLYHGHDERIPIEGFNWGLRTFFEVVHRFCA